MLTLEGCNGRRPRVELRPEYVLGVPQSGRTALGGVPAPPMAASRWQKTLACDVARAVSQSSDADGPHPSGKCRLKALSAFARIAPVLRRHDVLLVADEVICGFRRLGRWFGSQHFGIAPDLITVAKGLTSGYAPLSACLVSAPIVDVLRDASAPFSYGYTYSGHPVAAAAALANLSIFAREELVERADRTGQRLQRELRARFARHPRLRDVRGVGLIAALEPRDPKDAKRWQALLLADGVITWAVAGAVALSAPLTLAEDELDELVAALQRALEKLA
jgi:L-2,4-diaminobutyrate transaminase